jgi:plasmid stabilization system protein ParE
VSWSVRLSPEAEFDVKHAAEWYDSQRPGLGNCFKAEILQVLRSLESNPFLSSKRHSTHNIRWRNASRFPYRAVYQISEDDSRVIVAAIVHTSRDDRHWQKRLGAS